MPTFHDDDLESQSVKSSGILKWTVGIVVITLVISAVFAKSLGTGNVGTLIKQMEQGDRPTVKVSREAIQRLQGSRELTYRATANGHFIVDANINGTDIPMLFDSGASTIALSLATAQSLGIRRHRLRFTGQVATANGVIPAAPITLDRVRIGQLVFYDVEATVIDAPLSISLLGMSFLERLDGFEVAANRLVLRW